MLDTSHVYTVQFEKEDIDKAKKIRLKEDDIPGKQHFLYENRWVGKLGEWGVDNCFPQLHCATEDYRSEKYDFYSDNTPYSYEVKTSASNNFFNPNYSFLLNKYQYENSPASIYIACFYQIPDMVLRIVGWVWGVDVKEMATLKKEGETLWGNSKVMSDMYMIPYRNLNRIGDLTNYI